MKRRAAVGVIVLGFAVLVLVLSSCSSASSPKSVSVPTTADSTSTTPVARAPQRGAAHRLLSAIALRRSDLPAGWTAKPAPNRSNDSGVQAAVVRCVGGRSTEGDKVDSVDSPSFVRGNATISSSVTRYRTRADIRSDVAMVHNPRISACFAHAAKTRLAAELPAGVTLDTARIRIAPARSGAAHNIIGTGTGTVRLSGNGHHLTVYLTVAFITGPRIEAEVDTDSLGRPVPQPVVDAAAAAVARRAGHAKR